MKRHKQPGSTKQLLTAIILLQLSWSLIWGLIPDKKIDDYLVDQWDMEDGLPSNRIRSIAQTPDGYLWIATAKGLVRFDGMKFSTIPFIEKEKIEPLKTIAPTILFTDTGGALWIGSSAGLTSYHSQTSELKTYTGSDGITRDNIRCIKEDMNGNLWISFQASYVNRFSKGEFTAFDASQGLEGKKICGIVEDRKGNLLFGSRENGVFKYKDGKFVKHPAAGLEKFQIVAMEEDHQGDMWIGTTNGLFRVTGKGTRRYTANDGLTCNFIISIREDSDRNLWIATIKGLNRIRKKQDGTVGLEGSIDPLAINCLFEDSEKNLWIGTDDSGIRRLKNGKFISYAPFEEYRDANPVSVFEDRHGDTWLGTLNGKLFRCRGSDVLETLEPPELAGTGITAIGEDAGGYLWLGTIGKGVFQKKKGTILNITRRDGLADNTVTSIYRDSHNNLWFSTFDGVSVRRYVDGVFKSFTSAEGLKGKEVHHVYEDKAHKIWISTDKGISLLSNVFGKPETFLQKGFHSPKVILPGVSVSYIYEDPSTGGEEGSVYWIATDGAGLKRFVSEDRPIVSYTTADGMTTNNIYQFFEDRQGDFWFMSDSGILRVSKSELNRFAEGNPDKINCISYGISDGMKSTEFHNKFSGNSALQAGNGELWFITTKGISIVKPDKIRINKTPPPVVIEAVFFNRQSVPLHRPTGAYTFTGIKDFSCYFIAPTFLSPEKVRFKYRLEGFEKQWVYLDAGRERIAEYRDLAPGIYTFNVTACNAEGIWNQKGDSFNFTLKPFFHETPVFKLALFLLIAALSTAAFYIYKKRPFDKKKKYKDSHLHPHFAEECIKKLEHLMQKEKVYRDEKISLQSLAEKLSIKPHQLSQILNDKLNQSFPDFINYYRIEEAKKILASPKGAEKKNTAIAFDVGFNSMTAFYKAFKKFTDMTPNRYKKEIES